MRPTCRSLGRSDRPSTRPQTATAMRPPSHRCRTTNRGPSAPAHRAFRQTLVGAGPRTLAETRSAFSAKEAHMTPPATTKLHVADLMTIDPIVVSVDATIEEAEEQLRYHRVTGLPVVDLSGRLVGVISQTDLLYLAVPTVQALIRHRESGIRVGE